MPKPFLSIGIIFKNEIHCLERCLTSLTPLREALPCELIMADTGSEDGSRAVAEQYADVLFDFPWINDFAAARNAVMDRSTGRWYLSLDADEWLDGDIKELVNFLRNNNKKSTEGATLCIRNYMGRGENADYGDFFATRILRMSTGLRFQGAVHEMWRWDDGRNLSTERLNKTILHHDGYVGLNAPEGAAKRQRNQAILDARLEKDPENVRLLLQYIESSRPDPQHVDYLHRAIAAVEAKQPEWTLFGPVIYRYAVLAAVERDLPELTEWIARAEELFPDSFYTNIDIAYRALFFYWEKEDYASCVRYGETYLTAVEDYDAGRGDQVALMASTLLFTAPHWRDTLRQKLATACRKEGRPARAMELLEEIERLNSSLVKETLETLWELQIATDQDTAPYILRLYERITDAENKESEALWTAFLKTAPLAFGPDVREKEKAREDFHRYSYTLYLPLAGKCEAGNAAAVMEAESVQELDELLGKVETWGDFSVSALIHALEKGASFPPANMRMDEMDHIAERLAQYKGRFFDVVCQSAEQLCSGSWRQLIWARSMAFAAVQAFDWIDEQRGLALTNAFIKVVGTFVSRCYTPEVLCEENIQVLPSLHQFGWYSSRAFQALESGETTGYVRLLRAGLEACPEMKVMVEFLTKHTPQLNASPSRELLELAEKVRTLLAAYDPKDPTVAVLKQSPAYQKVAHLIEGIEVPVVGGLPQ